VICLNLKVSFLNLLKNSLGQFRLLTKQHEEEHATRPDNAFEDIFSFAVAYFWALFNRVVGFKNAILDTAKTNPDADL
jgi:predicted transcriptional regulator YheO